MVLCTVIILRNEECGLLCEPTQQIIDGTTTTTTFAPELPATPSTSKIPAPSTSKAVSSRTQPTGNNSLASTDDESVSSRSTPSTIKLDYGVDMMEKTTVLVIGVATVIICICICICSAVVWGWRNTAWSYNRIVLDEKIEEADSAEERGMIQMSIQAAWKQCGRDEL